MIRFATITHWHDSMPGAGVVHSIKSRGGERHGNVGAMTPAGTVERGERK